MIVPKRLFVLAFDGVLEAHESGYVLRVFLVEVVEAFDE